MIDATSPSYSHLAKLVEQCIEDPCLNTLDAARRAAMAAGLGPHDWPGLADKLDAESVFRMDGLYWTGCGPDEIAEVQHGGAFWATPVPLGQDVAQWILDGREAPEL